MIKYLFCFLLIVSCSSYPKKRKITRKKPLVAFYKKKGKASWYGPGFHGKKTASGQIFDMRKPTGAHKTLPLGTRVKVTNLKTAKSIIITINDRGPYVKGRILDLSKFAFSKIASLKEGVIDVYIQKINF